jgi:hypothetical protein
MTHYSGVRDRKHGGTNARPLLSVDEGRRAVGSAI